MKEHAEFFFTSLAAVKVDGSGDGAESPVVDSRGVQVCASAHTPVCTRGLFLFFFLRC